MKKHTKFFAYLAVFSALTFVTTVSVAIPIPATSGYVNFGDTIIFIAAATIGPFGGMLVGSIGSLLADLVYAPYWAPVTLVVKGLEGLISGAIILFFKHKIGKKNNWCAIAYIIAFILGALTMLAGYYVGGGLLVGLVNDNNFGIGFAAALIELPANSIQGGVSVAIAYALSLALIQIPYVRATQSEFLH